MPRVNDLNLSVFTERAGSPALFLIYLRIVPINPANHPFHRKEERLADKEDIFIGAGLTKDVNR